MQSDRPPLQAPPTAPTGSPTVGTPAAEAPATGLAWSSEHLFGGRTEIEITHGPHRYRLRQTSLGKLILTK